MGLQHKHRPSDFPQIIGNVSTVKSLQSVLKRPKPPQAYLLIGPPGCGKTTLGRIIQNHLGCSEYDYKEMDSADFRGIDHIREIRKQMRLKPLSGTCKVWLLDECHQLSRDAMSALLKALEDTPPHVYFILATTDPQKLLKTIRSRCSTFPVDALDDDDLMKLLRRVASREKKPVPKPALRRIIRDCFGSPRTALVMLDKIIDLPQEEMEEAAAQQTHSENEVIDLCQALIKKSSWKSVSKILKNLNDDPESVRRVILQYFSTVLMNSGNTRTWEIMSCFQDPFYDNGRPGLIMACYEACTI